MVYFDNAATTFPKPLVVKNAALNAITIYGGNPGRSGHRISMRVAQQIFRTREIVADFFDAKAQNVIFTSNCTHSLNIAIQGIMRDGGHIIISSMEHNSVARPVYALAKKDVTYSVATVNSDDRKTVENFRRLITKDTKAIVCTIASNVTGQILPYKQIAKLCRDNDICFIADGAQACGIIPIRMSDGINILCTAGHKGLYGTTGTGIFITDGKYPVSPLMQGGTGTTSDELEQPDFLPEMLESGTCNTVGIISLGAGIEFIRQKKAEHMFKHENALCNEFINLLSRVKKVIIYRDSRCSYVPIVSFNIKGMQSDQVAHLLNTQGFALRGGLHCAILAHTTIGTDNIGTVRFAPSVFNNKAQVNALYLAVKKIAEGTLNDL